MRLPKLLALLLVGFVTNVIAQVEPDPPECLRVSEEKLECTSQNTWQWTATITNLAPWTASWLAITDLPAGMTVNGQSADQLIPLAPPLPSGQSTTVLLNLAYSGTLPAKVCHRFAIHDATLARCCFIDHCWELPECCAKIVKPRICCDPNSPTGYTLSGVMFNLSGKTMATLIVAPDASSIGCFPPVSIPLNPPLPNGGSQPFSIPLDINPDCIGKVICFYVSGHTKDYELCCSEYLCLKVPCCCEPFTYTLDADFGLGTMINLNQTPGDQLQLNAIAKPAPYVNIANSGRGTVVRIDVNTGAILGEYYTSPDGMGRNPSRTTVDHFGNCWVANRQEFGTSGGQSKGSVVRIGLILGGTRGDKVGTTFVPNPTGQYLQGPFTYNTCQDRDADGLIKTSMGLADIRPWTNAASADTHGGVSTADDECITAYTRVNGAGTRFMSIDCNNDLWTGGLSDQDFQKVDGTTGLPVPAFDFTALCGGYGGLIDGYGVLWSTGQIMRVPAPPAPGSCLPQSGYGMGIDPRNCHVWFSNAWSNANGWLALAEMDPAGNIVNSYPAAGGGIGMAIDGNGDVWVARGNDILHLAPVGPSHVIVGAVALPGPGGPHVRGVAVDTNGKIWAPDYSQNKAYRIDPTLAAGVGAVDLTVDLGAGATPYNYSDMTGFVALGATCRTGSWTVIHKGECPGVDWGTVSWNAQTDATNTIEVEVRADDNAIDLPTKPFVQVGNGKPFCDRGISGQFIEIRVKFTGEPCTRKSPILFDLTLECCSEVCDPLVNTPPQIVHCPKKVSQADASLPVWISTIVSDADGDALTVTWQEGANPPLLTDSFAAGLPPTMGTSTLNTILAAGVHVITLTVDDGKGTPVVCEITVCVGDTQPPIFKAPPGVHVEAWAGAIPKFVPIGLSDDTTPAGEIVVVQRPAAGTIVSEATTVVLTATDAAGRKTSHETFFNPEPLVTLDSPPNYSVFPDSQTLPDFTASATPIHSEDGVETHPVVEIYLNNIQLGTANSPPYRVPGQSVPPGAYTGMVAAIGPDGRVVLSRTYFFTVGSEPLPSPLRVMNVRCVPEGEMSFEFVSIPGKDYRIEASSDLKTWVELFDAFPSAGDVTTFIDDPRMPARFYRIQEN